MWLLAAERKVKKGSSCAYIGVSGCFSVALCVMAVHFTTDNTFHQGLAVMVVIHVLRNSTDLEVW
jgi:hypothetical protein